jgi:hypothetical protein
MATVMDKAMAQRLSDEIARAAKEIGEKLGMDVANKGGRYDSGLGTFSPRLEFRMREVGGVSRDQAEFNLYCDSFGLDQKHYGVEISHGPTRYRVVGFRPRKKNSVLVERVPSDGKQYVLPERVLDQIPERRGKWRDRFQSEVDPEITMARREAEMERRSDRR